MEKKEKKQTTLVIGEEATRQLKEKLGIGENPENSMCNIPLEQRPYVGNKVTDVSMENFVMVSGNAEDNNLKVTVVSVYNIANPETMPDPVMLENEIDVWRQHLLADISGNSEMLAKALKTIVR